MNQPLNLRLRNRLATIKLVQLEAIRLIETQGFDSTTIDQVSQSTGVSPSTIFRHFGTKENLVLWDELDDRIEKLLLQKLPETAPLTAFRESVLAALTQQEDMDLFLRRTKLIFGVPAIWSAAALEDRNTRAELAKAFSYFSGRRKPIIKDSLLAATCMSTLDVALDTWQAGNGKTKLGSVIEQAFDSLESF